MLGPLQHAKKLHLFIVYNGPLDLDPQRNSNIKKKLGLQKKIIKNPILLFQWFITICNNRKMLCWGRGRGFVIQLKVIKTARRFFKNDSGLLDLGTVIKVKTSIPQQTKLAIFDSVAQVVKISVILSACLIISLEMLGDSRVYRSLWWIFCIQSTQV